MHAVTELFPNPAVGNAVHEYCIQHSTPVPEHINRHREDTIRWAEETGGNADMMINTLQSQFMIWFIKSMGIKSVLEIGCFTGYSALSFAEALKGNKDAEITSLDLPGASSAFALESFKKYQTPAQPKINLIEGPAAQSLQTLAGRKYDLIFLDANKDGYTEYFRTILDLGLLSQDGVLIADNTLKCGLVADSSPNNPAAREGPNSAAHGGMSVKEHLKAAKWLDEFNRTVKEDGRVENVLVPMFDGLNFVRLKKRTTDGSGEL
ncbi:O-methyltransferase-domain-containing protein [Peziza echinospora]|nr:O-methyltransferase-domain-containing protein [Peziza echinospora]